MNYVITNTVFGWHTSNVYYYFERLVKAQAAFNRKLEEVKSEHTTKKRQVVDKVNMTLVHEKGGAFYLGSIFGQDA